MASYNKKGEAAAADREMSKRSFDIEKKSFEIIDAEIGSHHYIRTVLSDGIIGTEGTLKSGDELLEVR